MARRTERAPPAHRSDPCRFGWSEPTKCKGRVEEGVTGADGTHAARDTRHGYDDGNDGGGFGVVRGSRVDSVDGGSGGGGGSGVDDVGDDGGGGGASQEGGGGGPDSMCLGHDA